jgi:hypothetical protein
MNFVVGEARLLAQLEPPELLDLPDDADAPSLFVQHFLRWAGPLPSGDLILLERCRDKPVIGRGEHGIEPPLHAVLVLDSVCKIRIWSLLILVHLECQIQCFREHQLNFDELEVQTGGWRESSGNDKRGIRSGAGHERKGCKAVLVACIIFDQDNLPDF